MRKSEEAPAGAQPAGISEKEALRALLACGWELFEDAEVGSARVDGKWTYTREGKYGRVLVMAGC